MKYLLVVILMLCPVAHAQTEPEKAEDPQFQTAMGSTDTLPSQGIPAIYPGAASEEAVAATITTAPVVTPSRQREWSDIEVYLTFAILAFTLVAWGMLAYLARNAQKAWSPQSILRVFGITLIIPMAVLLIVAGYSEKQIASVVGLLGVIAGYLLGNGDRPRAGA
ncbi:hypothetical protein [Lysobacter sp. F60174L2]|uniref:hypothetical protein n=1 Tax=Lysobacter sp. F60174L2 TaxID=3459295 RepID=UPI00403D5725